MKKLIALLAILALSACGKPDSVVVTSPRHMVVMPAEEMFICDPADPFPDPETLTDIRAARIMGQLYQNNVKCRRSLIAIKKFLEDAKKTVESDTSADSTASKKNQ
jgi:hypothetical protein